MKFARFLGSAKIEASNKIRNYDVYNGNSLEFKLNIWKKKKMTKSVY